jgi:hypothetical protein
MIQITLQFCVFICTESCLVLRKRIYILLILELTQNFLYAKEEEEFRVGIATIIRVSAVECKVLAL